MRLALVAALVCVVAACGSAAPTSGHAASPPTTRAVAATSASTLQGHPAYAVVVFEHADVYDEPGGHVTMTMPARTTNGAPTTLLVRDEGAYGGGVWYRVALPVRPNGTTGWVRAADVRVAGLRYRLVVRLGAFTLDLYDGDRLAQTFPIGVGTDETPTPNGTYYVTELLKPPDQDTEYGHYVFALSGFSEVLRDWVGGGVLGIHGTNDPTGSIGRRVSHGCIRLRNEDIEQLVSLLPLGTPVVVTA